MLMLLRLFLSQTLIVDHILILMATEFGVGQQIGYQAGMLPETQEKQI